MVIIYICTYSLICIFIYIYIYGKIFNWSSCSHWVVSNDPAVPDSLFRVFFWHVHLWFRAHFWTLLMFYHHFFSRINKNSLTRVLTGCWEIRWLFPSSPEPTLIDLPSSHETLIAQLDPLGSAKEVTLPNPPSFAWWARAFLAPFLGTLTAHPQWRFMKLGILVLRICTDYVIAYTVHPY